MKKLLFTITLFLIQITFAFTPIEKGDLIFEINGFENNDGKAVLYLFREEDELPEKPFKIVSASISEKAATIELKELQYGEYAVIVFQDVNNNDILDHKFFLPAEPMVFSKNWHLSLFSGMPTFEKLKFLFSKNSNSYKLKIE